MLNQAVCRCMRLLVLSYSLFQPWRLICVVLPHPIQGGVPKVDSLNCFREKYVLSIMYEQVWRIVEWCFSCVLVHLQSFHKYINTVLSLYISAFTFHLHLSWKDPRRLPSSYVLSETHFLQFVAFCTAILCRVIVLNSKWCLIFNVILRKRLFFVELFLCVHFCFTCAIFATKFTDLFVLFSLSCLFSCLLHTLSVYIVYSAYIGFTLQ